MKALKLKSDIKVLAKKQRETKEQRKTERFTGTRTMKPWEAQMAALSQKDDLKHMYIAYAKLRNKPIETCISEKTEYSESRVEKLMEKYAEVVCVSENGS